MPVHFMSVQARWFGVAPAALLLVVAGLTALVRILLFALGHRPAGLILLGLALLSLAAIAEAAKRKPDSPFRAPLRRRVPRGAGAGQRRRRLGRARHELVGLERLRGRK